MRGQGYGSYQRKSVKLARPQPVVKELPGIDVFIASVIAFRLNGGKYVKDQVNQYDENGLVVGVVEPNKYLMRKILQDDKYQDLFTEADRQEGEAVQSYWRMKMFAILSGNTSEYLRLSVEVASAETIKSDDFYKFGLIARLPYAMEEGMKHDKVMEMKQDAMMVSEHFGKVNDRISGKVKILDCFYSQKWLCYYTTGVLNGNTILWSGSKSCDVGAEFSLTGRVMRHRDNNVTQLHYVRLS